MKLLLVGSGGYAGNYIKILLNREIPELFWEGIVDPFYAACAYKDQIDALGIPVYATMEEFYSRHTADLAVISTPTFLHREQSIFALAHGSHVLCEKPAAPTEKEALEMLQAQEKYGHFLAIGYQWSYSDAIQKLKQDLLNGVLGKPVSLKTAISWPRNRAYYSRGSGWAGKIQQNGCMILDSIASNACAHYLHNMLFLLGERMGSSANVKVVQGECYRANDIENFDTCTLRLETESGAELYFAATHAANQKRNPIFSYTFEKAVVTYSRDEGSQIVARFSDSSTRVYGDPFESPFKKLFDAVECVKHGKAPLCTVESALPHVRLIQSLYHTVPVHDFPKDKVLLDPQTDGRYVEGLFKALYSAYDKKEMLSQVAPQLFK